MSKFIEKLKKVGEVGPSRLGFGVGLNQESNPNILLIGSASLKGLIKKQSLRKSPVDAFMVSVGRDDSLADVGNALESLLWGVKPDLESCAQAFEQVNNAGGDFIVFNAEGAPVEILADENLGKVIIIAEKLDEDTARGIDDLPIDVVLFSSLQDMLPLTVERLIGIQASRSLVAKYVLLEAPGVLESKELVALRDMGIDGLVVDLEAINTTGLKKLRSDIGEMPRKRARQEKVGALLPRAGFGTARPGPDREEEEEYDD